MHEFVPFRPLLQGLDAADATWSMASLTAFMRLCKSPVKRSSRVGAALLACVCLDESRFALRLVGPVSLPARKPLGHGPMATNVRYQLASMGDSHDAKYKTTNAFFVMMLTRQHRAAAAVGGIMA